MDTVIKGPVTIAQGRSVHGYSKPAAPNFFFMTYKQLRQYWSTINLFGAALVTEYRMLL